MNLTNSQASAIVVQYFYLHDELPGHIRTRYIHHPYVKETTKENETFNIVVEDFASGQGTTILNIKESELVDINNRYHFV